MSHCAVPPLGTTICGASTLHSTTVMSRRTTGSTASNEASQSLRKTAKSTAGPGAASGRGVRRRRRAARRSASGRTADARTAAGSPARWYPTTTSGDEARCDVAYRRGPDRRAGLHGAQPHLHGQVPRRIEEGIVHSGVTRYDVRDGPTQPGHHPLADSSPAHRSISGHCGQPSPNFGARSSTGLRSHAPRKT